jgi:hypothetical protein
LSLIKTILTLFHKIPDMQYFEHYKLVTTTRPHLAPHITYLSISPHSGIPYLLIGVYMPQLHTTLIIRLYAEFAAWGMRLADDHPTHRVLWDGDFQTTTH